MHCQMPSVWSESSLGSGWCTCSVDQVHYPCCQHWPLLIGVWGIWVTWSTWSCQNISAQIRTIFLMLLCIPFPQDRFQVQVYSRLKALLTKVWMEPCQWPGVNVMCWSERPGTTLTKNSQFLCGIRPGRTTKVQFHSVFGSFATNANGTTSYHCFHNLWQVMSQKNLRKILNS